MDAATTSLSDTRTIDIGVPAFGRIPGNGTSSKASESESTRTLAAELRYVRVRPRGERNKSASNPASSARSIARCQLKFRPLVALPKQPHSRSRPRLLR